MNEFTAHEHHAAAQLQAKAATLVCTYAHPEDAAAARLAVLMTACQNEAREQGITAPLIFAHELEALALPVIDMAAPGAAAALVAISGAKHDQGKDGV